MQGAGFRPALEANMSDTRNRVSPIVAIAAVAVIIFSAVGVGVMTGIIPSSFSKGADPLPSTERAASPAEPQPAMPTAANAPVAEPTGHEPARTAANQAPQPTPAVCADCGKVTTINIVEQQGEGTGLGAVAGGVIGGVLGNQIGHGTGRKVATVAGAAGGAYAGHQAEKQIRSTRQWRVAVRMDDGSTRMFRYDQEPAVRVGDPVKVRDGRLMLN